MQVFDAGRDEGSVLRQDQGQIGALFLHKASGFDQQPLDQIVDGIGIGDFIHGATVRRRRTKSIRSISTLYVHEIRVLLRRRRGSYNGALTMRRCADFVPQGRAQP